MSWLQAHCAKIASGVMGPSLPNVLPSRHFDPIHYWEENDLALALSLTAHLAMYVLISFYRLAWKGVFVLRQDYMWLCKHQQGSIGHPTHSYGTNRARYDHADSRRLASSAGKHGRRRRLAGDTYGDEDVVSIPEIDSEAAARLKAIEDGDMQAELKHIDRKYTEQGQVYYAETVEEVIPEQINWWSKFALCLVRHTVQGNPDVIQKVSLQINSQHLKDILKETIKGFPGASFETQEITIDAPYRVLFHYRRELEAAGEDLADDSEAAEHLALLLRFIADEFRETIEETRNLNDQGLISYQYLWTLFRPGTIIFGSMDGQPRAFRLKDYAYSCDPAGLFVENDYVDFDGAAMGYRASKRLLPKFSGTKRICDLSAYPINWHPDAEDIKQQLVARGRRFEALASMGFYRYSGIAIDRSAYEQSKFHVIGRVVVDTKTFHRMNANHAFVVSSFRSDGEERVQRDYVEDENGMQLCDLDPQEEQKLELEPLEDEQCLLATAMVRGFSFTEKKWFDFFVDQLSPPNWDTQCFDQLVLPNTQKQLVRALVTTHSQRQDTFDDIVQGKGKGLVMVLHGPPGVGKTLTAETVAEFCQRPLYMVSSGDLGTKSSSLDKHLSRILDMASTWKAVLLIDEADIFLEQRSLHDLERNSLVSIFLRVLEYYEGILFLTSNRVATFDDAFKSRIHVPLRYNDLTATSRKQIWKNFLDGGKEDDGVDATAGTSAIDEAGYDVLAEAPLNGRQIKNVVRTASSLAQFAGEQLDVAKLQQVITIQSEFERELDTGGVMALS
nr:atpase family aaa domain-containing protein 3b [Quercus suber]